jgi:Tol biopolymer transport system component
MVKKIRLIWPLTLIFILSTYCEVNKYRDYEWNNLKNLGKNINSEGTDEHVTLTEDAKTMYFASKRKGNLGGYDLFMSCFKNEEWTTAERLSYPINTEKDEFDPFISLDGTKLFFASNRDNSEDYWDCDIYMSEWDGSKWSNPRSLDPVFNSPDKPDWGVAITQDFKTLIFSSGREPVKSRSVQIFQSFWLGDRWSLPEILPAPVNTGVWEATPFITPDGTVLYLNSARGPSDKKDVDIWKFEFKDNIWTDPQLMNGPFLSDKNDYDPCLSFDGQKFFFTSDREGGFGDSDIYVVDKARTTKK